MARWPLMISLIRRGGTAMSLARRYWVIPFGLKNSSSRISPGVMFVSNLLFIFNDDPQFRPRGRLRHASESKSAIGHLLGCCAGLYGCLSAPPTGFPVGPAIVEVP